MPTPTPNPATAEMMVAVFLLPLILKEDVLVDVEQDAPDACKCNTLFKWDEFSFITFIFFKKKIKYNNITKLIKYNTNYGYK